MVKGIKFELFYNIINLVCLTCVLNNNRAITMFLILLNVTGILFSLVNGIGKGSVIILLSLSIVMLLSISTMVSNYNTSIITTIMIFVQSIGSFLIGYSNPYNNDLNKSFLKFIIYFNIFLSIYGLLIYYLPNTIGTINFDGVNTYVQIVSFLGISLRQVVIIENITHISISSLTNNPNTLSFLLLIASISVLYFLFNKDEHSHFFNKKGCLICTFLLFVFTLFKAGSRICIVVLFVSFILFDYMRIKAVNKSYFKRRWYLIFVIVFFVICFVGNYSTIIKYIDLNGREKGWKVFKAYSGKCIIWGIGLGNSLDLLLSEIGSRMGMHNTYFALWLEMGLIPLLAIGFIIVRSAASSFMKYSISKVSISSKFLNGCLFIFLVDILLIGITENTIFTFSVFNYLFFFVLGVLIKGGDVCDKYNYNNLQ